MKRFLLLACILVVAVPAAYADELWKAGAASVVITPEHSMWMAGYGARKTPSTGKRTELFAKALALEDAEANRGVIITLDLVGIDRRFAQAVTKRLEKEFDLSREQVALCTSHTHSGPVVGRNLAPLHYLTLDEQQQEKIDAYEEDLREKLVELTGQALDALSPARLQQGSGKATFAVNRRENKPESDVPSWREKGELKDPVDHDVPVLSVRDPDGNLKAVLFGYACHATVLQASEWNGDYPGYAQAKLERDHPGAVALFWAGCGGDQNPLPRRELPLAEQYGADLADRVTDVLEAPMAEAAPSLSVSFREIDAALEVPSREEISANAKSENRFEVARARYLLRKMEEKGAIDGVYPYPVGVWKIGDSIDFVFLGGEVVVDYALRLKRERHGTSTWVAAYANDVMAYIPSRRVLEEGGYEGGGSNVYYGLPGLWKDSIEETVVDAVNKTP
ncbi:MAG: neutral/alkaline non-lysosomal ceramidase N-terminal domain-containing protein [Verrucomicrobiales bacterium]